MSLHQCMLHYCINSCYNQHEVRTIKCCSNKIHNMFNQDALSSIYSRSFIQNYFTHLYNLDNIQWHSFIDSGINIYSNDTNIHSMYIICFYAFGMGTWPCTCIFAHLHIEFVIYYIMYVNGNIMTKYNFIVNIK